MFSRPNADNRSLTCLDGAFMVMHNMEEKEELSNAAIIHKQKHTTVHVDTQFKYSKLYKKNTMD